MNYLQGGVTIVKLGFSFVFSLASTQKADWSTLAAAVQKSFECCHASGRLQASIDKGAKAAGLETVRMGKWSFSKSVTVKRAKSARSKTSTRNALTVSSTESITCGDKKLPAPGPTSDAGGGLRLKSQKAAIEV